jgi:hypothetical protein
MPPAVMWRCLRGGDASGVNRGDDVEMPPWRCLRVNHASGVNRGDDVEMPPWRCLRVNRGDEGLAAAQTLARTAVAT